MAETSEMVERVRDAIDAAWMDWNLGDGRGRPQADVPVELLAIAAIRGMREPTRAMALAGATQMNRHKIVRSPFKAGSPDIYAAMIDAALPSPPSPG